MIMFCRSAMTNQGMIVDCKLIVYDGYHIRVFNALAVDQHVHSYLKSVDGVANSIKVLTNYVKRSVR